MNEMDALKEQFFEHIQLGQVKAAVDILHAHPDATGWNMPGTDGRKALHIAAIHTQPEMVQALVAAGADIEAKDNGGETALGWACLRVTRSCIAKLLLALGANPDARLKGGATPLLRAAEGKSCTAAEALVQAGANINAKNDAGSTALHVAASIGDSGMIRLLVTLGADASIKNAAGQSVNAENSNFRPVVELALIRKREEEDLIQAQMKEGSGAAVAVHKPLKFKANRLSS
ncbi:MAG: ankyrin repeat domain-containing protein [Alphaproteobacteria bacterium]